MSIQGFINNAINYSIEVSNNTHSYILPNDLIIDGNFHHYNGKPDRKRDKKEAYIAKQLDSGHLIVSFCSFTHDKWHTYRSYEGTSLSSEELDRIREDLKEVTRRAVEFKAQEHAKAAERAMDIWNSSTPCNSHPYLTKKKISGDGCREKDGYLIIPIYNAENDSLMSLQSIGPDGSKRFMPGGRVDQGYFQIGLGDNPFIGEGYATCKTVHDITREGVICAFSASNCAKVALHLRNRGNITSARLLQDLGVAGKEVCKSWDELSIGDVYAPSWGHRECKDGSDWNDLYVELGAEEVKSQLKPRDYKVFSVVDFLDLKVADPEWSIENFMSKGSDNLVYAAPGVGKSMFSTDIAIACSSGSRLFNGWNCKKQSVLYVDGEMNTSCLQERWRSALKRWSACNIGSCESIDVLAWLHIQEECKINLNLYCPLSRSYLDKHISRRDLIVFDNLDCLTADTGEEDFKLDEKNWSDFRKWMLSWCQKGKTFLTVMHSVKSGGLAGTRKILGQTHTAIKLTKLPSELLIDSGNLGMAVSFEKHRTIKPEFTSPFSIEMLNYEDSKTGHTFPWIQHTNEHIFSKIEMARSAQNKNTLKYFLGL